MSNYYNYYRDGYEVHSGLIDQQGLAKLCQSLEMAYHYRQQRYPKIKGVVHHLPAHLYPWAQILDEMASTSPIHARIKDLLEGPYILNSFGAVLNHLTDDSYVQDIHVDQRTFTGEFCLMLNMLVMLDDFTEENGATWVVPGSHRYPGPPPGYVHEEQQVTGKAGTVVIWNSQLWHRAGYNHTSEKRRALTLTFSRPFMKPQFDYLASLSAEEIESLTPHLRQVLGYNSRVPATLGQWYQPVEKRYYQPGQG